MTFKEEIIADINWRVSELASLKTIPFRYNITESHKNILIKYTMPSIYSLWEGFIKSSFQSYIRELNNLNIPIQNTHINLLTHTITTKDKLNFIVVR